MSRVAAEAVRSLAKVVMAETFICIRRDQCAYKGQSKEAPEEMRPSAAEAATGAMFTSNPSKHRLGIRGTT